MWAKELVTKYQKPFTVKSSIQYGAMMYHYRAEDRLDEDQVTPKGRDCNLATKFTFYKKNLDTTVPHREYEENEVPPPGQDKHMKEVVKNQKQFLIKNQKDY